MKTVKPDVLKHMMKQLEKYSEFFSIDIPEWSSYDGQYLGNGEYEFYKITEKKMKLGDHWDARYDCARIFYADVSLPEKFDGQKLYLKLDFGGEILVRINNKIIGSVSSRMNGGWVARDTINLLNNEDISGGKTFRIELEACVDSGGFCDIGMDGGKSIEYTLQTAKIIAVDSVCEKYILDVYNIWDAMPQIDDEFIKTKVYEAFDNSLHMVDFDFDEEQVRTSIAEASAYLDKALGDIKYVPQSQVIMDGHSHIDVAWLWRIQESERKAARTFSGQLSLMDVYSDFTFTQSQAILYDMVKRLYPDIYERIKEKVKNGQWNIVGNAWVEADTNIASGEAMIRQLLYGREFFKNEFGVVSDTYWLPDCFGFSWSLPQIIKRSGMKYFITSKLMSQDTNRFPHTLFRWRGVDGSEIIAYHQRTHYQGDYTPSQIRETSYKNDEKDAVDTTFGMFGYGDGGGGCTYRMIENARRLQSFPGLPSSKMGHPEEFFEKADESREKLPIYNDELYYENHRGTYTSQAFIKKGNRRSEFLMCRAEEASVFAKSVSSFEYDRQHIEALWKTVLKNQFHDILPGTSIHEAIEDCRPDFARVMAEGEEIKQAATQELNSLITAPSDGVIVWNMLGHTVTAPASAEVESFDVSIENMPSEIYEKDGKPYIRFIAKDVPPLGYKFYPFSMRNLKSDVTVTENLLENSRLRVTLDNDGIITSIFDKTNNRETLSGNGNELSIFIDKCVHETAWNLELNYNKKQWVLQKAESVDVVESNALRGIIRIVRRFNKSTITQDVILYAESDHVDFDTTVDWQERDKVLKASFDVDILNNEATFDIAHGAIKRPTHWNNSFDMARFEQCAHKWADLSEGDYGVSILNDCKYGYDIKDNRMRITLMRAPTCPDRSGDIGISSFVYSFYPHAGTWQSAETVERALELNVPLEAYVAKKQSGKLPQELSFVSVDRNDVVVDAVKQAQDGRGIIIRVHETKQGRGKVNVSLKLPFEKVIECNLMEEDETEIKAEQGCFSFDVKPFEVKTFRLI